MDNIWSMFQLRYFTDLRINSLIVTFKNFFTKGNIIMVQLENEYGSYGLQTSYCDVRYMKHLHDLVRQHLGIKSLKVKFKMSVDHTSQLFLKQKLDYFC
jgi:beta-galactosidase GanA